MSVCSPRRRAAAFLEGLSPGGGHERGVTVGPQGHLALSESELSGRLLRTKSRASVGVSSA